MHLPDPTASAAPNRPLRALWKRVLAGFLSVTLALPGPVAFAQQPMMIPGGIGGAGWIQDLIRGVGGSGGFGGGVTPRPPSASDPGSIPQRLSNPGANVRFQCRFVNPGQDMAGGLPVATAPGLNAGSSVAPLNARSGQQGGQSGGLNQQNTNDAGMGPGAANPVLVGPAFGYVPNDFELYVESKTGRQLCRFGYQASYDASSFFEPPPLALVPEDYVLGPGDEVYVRLWGSIELDTVLVIDRSGQVVVPRVGPVRLGGIRYGQASDVVRQATRRLFSEFNASVTLGRLRGIRVYVTGYADRPGAYNVSNLTTLSSVVMSTGGPSKSGSYRNIQLKRAGKVISGFDLYDLLLKGDKSADRPLLSEDVIHFGPIGGQVAVLGGVSTPAVYETKPGETLEDLITMSGGLTPGADRTSIHRLGIDEREQGFRPVPMDQLKLSSLKSGDIFIARNDSRFAIADDRSTRRVTISGQVKNPGEYFLPPSTTLRDAIQMAGGFVPGAYPYGIQLTRNSVRLQQEATLERVLRELDREIVASSTIRPLNSDEARLLQVRADLSKTLVERLQTIKADGRLALPIAPNSAELPLVELESGDQIVVPLIPAHVGVYGSVVSGGTFLYRSNSLAKEYLAFAGGPTKGAEVSESFLIRANGQAEKISRGQGAAGVLGWAFGATGDKPIYPGDNIVVPEDMAKTTVYRELASWATLLYQIGLGAAALKVLRD